MLSPYKGKENDTLLKAYHYYRKKNQLDCKGLERIKKKKTMNTHKYTPLHRKQIYLPIKLRLSTANYKISFNEHLGMSSHSIS